jgi:5'-3' exonuclease
MSNKIFYKMNILVLDSYNLIFRAFYSYKNFTYTKATSSLLATGTRKMSGELAEPILNGLDCHASLAMTIPKSDNANAEVSNGGGYTEETSAVARKVSGELAEPTLVGEQKRIPKSDNANAEVSKVYEGMPIGAIYGFASCICDMINLVNPHHIIAAFESGRKGVRHEIYPEYKANRPAVDEDLVRQFPLLHEVPSYFNITPLRRDGFEADDVIASIVHRYTDCEVTIVSSDKDLLQLLEFDHVKIYNPLQKKYISRDDVMQKFEVEPFQISDLLSLTGDASDNIPGIPKIGIKTAAKLLKKFISIDNILMSLDVIDNKSDKKNLQRIKDNMKLLELSRSLVMLRVNICDDHVLEEWERPSVDRVYEFANKYRFTSLIKKLEKVSQIRQPNL